MVTDEQFDETRQRLNVRLRRAVTAALDANQELASHENTNPRGLAFFQLRARIAEGLAAILVVSADTVGAVLVERENEPDRQRH